MLHYLPDGEEDVPEEVDGDGRRQGEGGAVQTLAGVTGGNKTLISILCIKQDYMYIFSSPELDELDGVDLFLETVEPE